LVKAFLSECLTPLFCLLSSRDLYKLFSSHGRVLSVHIMVNNKTGVSRGYGFVSFSSPHEAIHARECLNGIYVSLLLFLLLFFILELLLAWEQKTKSRI
jgi:RNA recognition motif-containing protein